MCVTFVVAENFFPFSLFFPFSRCASTLLLNWSSCFSLQAERGKKRRKKQNNSFTSQTNSQPTPLTLSWYKKKKKTKEKAWADLRFTGVAICMLRPINFSWLSHYEHSQPEGGNAKLICVLKLLSQAGITGKCSDYPLGTGEGHVV